MDGQGDLRAALPPVDRLQPPMEPQPSPLDTLAQAATETSRPAPLPYPFPAVPPPRSQLDGFNMLSHAALFTSGGPMLPPLASAATEPYYRRSPSTSMPPFASSSLQLQAATHQIPDTRPSTSQHPYGPYIPSAPARPSYALPEDSGVIRCICPFEDDDGFTIQCDRCNAWQHAMCVAVKPDDVPDKYLCHLCDPRPLDVPLAKHRQQRRRQDEAARKAIYDYDSDGLQQLKHEARERALIDEVAEPATASTTNLSQSLPASFRSERLSPVTTTRPLTASTTTPPPSVTQQKRRSVVANESAQPAAKRKKTTRGPATPGEGPTVTLRRAEPRAATSAVVASQMLEDEDDTVDSQAAWQLEYTSIDESLWPDDKAVKQVAMACNAFHGAKTVTGRTTLLGEVTFSRRTRKKGDTKPPTLEEAPPRTAEFSTARREALAQLTLPSAPHLCPVLPDAVPLIVNRFPSAVGVHLGPSSVAPFAGPMSGHAPSSSCPMPRPYSYGVFAGTALFAGSFISEYLGEIIDLQAYRADPISQFDLLGCCKPHVRAIPPPWNVVVDARRYGNDTRYIRSSCHPNAVLRPIVNPHSKLASCPLTVTFGVFALCDIEKREEITLPWDWADEHLVHLLPQLLGQEAPSPQPRLSYYLDTLGLASRMATLIVTLLGITTCACDKRKDCAVAWLFKIAAVVRGTPKGGLSREEGFEAALSAAVTASKAETAGARKGKAPNLGPLVGLQRGWWPRPERLMELNRLVEEEMREAAASTSMEVDEAEASEGEAEVTREASRVAKSHVDAVMSSEEEEIVLRRVRRTNTSRSEAAAAPTTVKSLASAMPSSPKMDEDAAPAVEAPAQESPVIEEMTATAAEPASIALEEPAMVLVSVPEPLVESVVEPPPVVIEEPKLPLPKKKLSLADWRRGLAARQATAAPATPTSETIMESPAQIEPSSTFPTSPALDEKSTTSPALAQTPQFSSHAFPSPPMASTSTFRPYGIPRPDLAAASPPLPSAAGFVPVAPPPRPSELEERPSSSAASSPTTQFTARFLTGPRTSFPPVSTHFPAPYEPVSSTGMPSLYGTLSPSPEPEEKPLPPVEAVVEPVKAPTIPTGPRAAAVQPAKASPVLPMEPTFKAPPTGPAAMRGNPPTAPASHFRRRPSPSPLPSRASTPPPREPPHHATPVRSLPYSVASYKPSPRLGADEEVAPAKERSPPRGPRSRMASESAAPFAPPTGPRNSFPAPLLPPTGPAAHRRLATRSPSPPRAPRVPTGPRGRGDGAREGAGGPSQMYRAAEGMPYGASTYRPGGNGGPPIEPASHRLQPVSPPHRPASDRYADRPYRPGPPPDRERERERAGPSVERERERAGPPAERERERDRPFVDTASTYRPAPPPPGSRLEYDRPPTSWDRDRAPPFGRGRDDRRDRDDVPRGPSGYYANSGRGRGGPPPRGRGRGGWR